MTNSLLILDHSLLDMLASLNALHVWALSGYCHFVWSPKILEVLLLLLGLCLWWCVLVWSQTHNLVESVVMGRLLRVHQIWHFLYPVGILYLYHIFTVLGVIFGVLGWLLQWFSSICSSVVHDLIVLLWWTHMCSGLVSQVQRLYPAILSLCWSTYCSVSVRVHDV